MADVTITIGVDDSEANASIEAVKAKADAVVKDWAEKRRELLSQIRDAFGYVQSLISSFRSVMSLFDTQIHPFYDALLSIVTSTVSMMLAIATALAAGVVTSPFAAVVAGIAIGLNILTTAKLIADKAAIMASFADMKAQFSMADQRAPIGGSF